MRSFIPFRSYCIALLAIIITIAGCEKPNTPPVPAFTFTPVVGNTDSLITFDASASHDLEDESQTLQVRWDWNNDGSWDTNFSTGKIITHQFQELRDYTIVLEVKDQKGMVGTARKAIRISSSFPVVKTRKIESINIRSIQILGEILKDGGSQITACGACWSTHDLPMINDHSMRSENLQGAFHVTADNLLAGMVYYIRTYATNSRGTSYGEQLTLTTPGLAIIHTNPIVNITINSAMTGGNNILDGGSPLRYKGVCWSTQRPPQINDTKTMDGREPGDFESRVHSLIAGTTYYVRAYAINGVGTSYGEIQTFKTTSTVPTVEFSAIGEITRTTVMAYSDIYSNGGESILARGVCWSLNHNPTTSDSKTSDELSAGFLSSKIEGLEPGWEYYLRAYATNIMGTAYSYEVPVSTKPKVLASVWTQNIDLITSTSAQSGGGITDDGGSIVTLRGVCWSTSQYPTIENDRTTDGSGNNAFTSSISPLSPNTTYYIRAYAVNEIGTSYGNQLTFKTKR